MGDSARMLIAQFAHVRCGMLAVYIAAAVAPDQCRKESPMASSTFRRTIDRWRARAWRSLPVLALALALMSSPTWKPPVADPPSQGESHPVRPLVNWNS
jgi:hypothetical protein